MRRLPSLLILVIVIASAAYGENWPNWRGPSASGVTSETGLPFRWSDTENVAWKSPIRGLGISTPIVWGDRVFLTSQVGSGQSRPGPRLGQGGDTNAGERALGGGIASATDTVSFLVTALDRVSGKRLWEYSLSAEGPLPSVHEKHNLASSSPVTDGRRIYAWFGNGQIMALDLEGKLVWKKHLGSEYGRFDISWGHGSSPAVYRDTVILICYQPSGSYLLGLDSATGNVRWKADQPQGLESYSTPIVVEAPSGAEIIVNSSVGVAGHDAATGNVLWQIDEPNRFPIPMPSLHDGVIYTTRGYRSSPFMAIRPGGRGKVAESHVIWRVPSGGPYVSSLIQYQGLIYIIGDVGVATVTDAKTGMRVWQERVGGIYTASPVAADGKVYFLSEDGETVVLSAGRTPQVLARNKLNARQLASPAISGGRLFIRSDDALYAIGR
jgi:outer membrane protein assembly factor BamB